jgi:hypothetical protein
MLVGLFVDAGISVTRFFRNVANLGRKGDALVMTLPLLITNIVATSLIGYKAW